MDKNNNGINLIYFFKAVQDKKRVVFSVLLVFFLLGLFIALTSKKMYTAKSLFIPQTSQQNNQGGSLGGLASLAGINIGSMSNSNDISPSLYPQFISSIKFKKKLAETKINLDGKGQTATYAEYYEKLYQPNILELFYKFTIGMPGEIIKFMRSAPPPIRNETNSAGENTFEQISYEEFELFARMDGQLSVVSMEEEGVVQLSFIMPDPLMAAQMAQSAESLLQTEIIDYKIKNASEQLKFTENQYQEKKAEFNEIQSRLAVFKDRNQNIVSAALLNQQDRLEAEYNFSFSIYTELAKQLEQAKLQVSKDTPVFSVIQKVSIPIQKSSPNRPKILLIFIFVGVVSALGYVALMWIIFNLKRDWKNID
ncbi:Wzz/FepE/Etk N-terminal domain-containing protein [Algoriphagus antarcticus]|uniref:Subunit length determinant protein n=1 Tax=Algoriphagus antarcticus TaxID=238540 RepID=A0A3E0DZG7_9BACT|nr:Wzz/FepE/Etk N-terminal domain-containing protein [Algoriphagus antarcticus]REG91477.1 subunit length determinant protein [Algoriphagus antarcticus]